MPLFTPNKVTQVEIDFGATPTASASFTITDDGIGTTSNIICTQDGSAATGRSADENEMDTLVFKPQAGAGQFVVLVSSEEGPVTGKYKFNYIFSS